MRSLKQSFDFHCHSTASDGTLSPVEVLELALASGLKSWSLTDHDTIAGYQEVMARLATLRQQSNNAGGSSEKLACGGVELASEPFEVVPGVEISGNWNGVTVHVLAFGFRPQAKEILTFLDKQQTRRQKRAIKIAERIESKLKVADAYQKACAISGDQLPARPHFAQLLIAENKIKSSSEAFAKYLGAGKWGDVKLFWPDLEELMQAVLLAGGVAVLAHPFQYRLTATKLRQLLDSLAGVGGAGAELAVPNISHGHYGWLVNELCRRKMTQSGGSDFHGSATPWSQLGHFPSLSNRIPTVAEMLE